MLRRFVCFVREKPLGHRHMRCSLSSLGSNRGLLREAGGDHMSLPRDVPSHMMLIGKSHLPQCAGRIDEVAPGDRAAGATLGEDWRSAAGTPTASPCPLASRSVDRRRPPPGPPPYHLLHERSEMLRVGGRVRCFGCIGFAVLSGVGDDEFASKCAVAQRGRFACCGESIGRSRWPR